MCGRKSRTGESVSDHSFCRGSRIVDLIDAALVAATCTHWKPIMLTTRRRVRPCTDTTTALSIIKTPAAVAVATISCTCLAEQAANLGAPFDIRISTMGTAKAVTTHVEAKEGLTHDLCILTCLLFLGIRLATAATVTTSACWDAIVTTATWGASHVSNAT